MKKQKLTYFLLVCIATLSFASCSDSDDPTPEVPEVINLPADAQSFLTYYLSDFTDPEIKRSEDKSTYTAYYKDADLSVNFNNEGKWTLAETSKVLPKSLLGCLPSKIIKASESLHKDDTIKGIEVKVYGYMLKLPKTTHLAYNTSGDRLGYDAKNNLENLSTTAKDFIQTHWSNAEIKSVIFNGDDYSHRYHLVYLSNNFILRFNYTTGAWQKVDGGDQPLTKELLSLLPEEATRDAENTTESPIVSMEIEQTGLYNFRYLNGSGATVITEAYKGKPSTSTEIYDTALAFIKLHWSDKDDVRISSFAWGSHQPDEYHFVLTKGFSCTFNPYKEWTIINGEDQEIPKSIQDELPSAVIKRVADGYFGNKIVKIEKVIEEATKLYYYISLNKADEIILKINAKGELISYHQKP